jgi:hypothetical protein
MIYFYIALVWQKIRLEVVVLTECAKKARKILLIGRKEMGFFLKITLGFLSH